MLRVKEFQYSWVHLLHTKPLRLNFATEQATWRVSVCMAHLRFGDGIENSR